MARVDYDHEARVAEAAERKRREDGEQLQAIRLRRDAEARIYEAAEQRELQRRRADQEAGEALRVRRESQHAARGAAQAAWALERTRLQAEADELRRLLVSAKGNIESAELDEARLAAADVVVYERRLGVAERVLAAHVASQPSP